MAARKSPIRDRLNGYFSSKYSILSLVGLHILMSIIMLFSVYELFVGIRATRFIYDELKYVQASVFGIDFIVQNDHFYFGTSVTICLIILLIIDILFFIGLVMFNKEKTPEK